MIKEGQKKPYAVPVKYFSYSTLEDADIRSLDDNMKVEIVKLGMTVVGTIASERTRKYITSLSIGFVSDGKFNLRAYSTHISPPIK